MKYLVTITQAATVGQSTYTGGIKNIALSIMNYLLFFVGAAIIASLVYAGLLYIISAGDADKVKRAHNAVLYAVIGVVVIVLSYAIVVALGSTISEIIY